MKVCIGLPEVVCCSWSTEKFIPIECYTFPSPPDQFLVQHMGKTVMLFVIGIWFARKYHYAQVPNKRPPFVLTEKRLSGWVKDIMILMNI